VQLLPVEGLAEAPACVDTAEGFEACFGGGATERGALGKGIGGQRGGVADAGGGCTDCGIKGGFDAFEEDLVVQGGLR